MANSGGGVKFFLWLFCLCSSLMGVQFVYSIQFALGAPLFQNQLRLAKSTIAIILATAGPISGFIVQPVVGVWSDGSRSRFGRRRPFILVGAVLCVLGMSLIGASVDLGVLLGDDRHGPAPSDHKAGIVLAISGLWLMNLFVNTIQGPARAIVVDLVDEKRQQDGNAMASGVMGMSGILANVIGAQLFFTAAPYRNLFFIGVGFVLLSVVPTMLAAKEKRYEPLPGEDTKGGGAGGVGAAFYRIYYAFRTIPRKMIIIVVVFFFSWCAYSPYMIYITTWFSDNVYGGGSRSDHGVQVGMYGLAVFAAAQWLFSLVLAPAIRCWTVNGVYATTQLLASACHAGFFFLTMLHSTTAVVAVAFTVMALLAINFTTMNAVPFGLVRGVTGNRDSGLYMGVLNAASVVAQTVTNMLSGLLLTLFEKKSDLSSDSSAHHTSQNVAIAIMFGAGLSLLATIASLFLKQEKAPDESEPLVINGGRDESPKV
jgi:solute carrier family 45 protein 1/2/4